MVKNNNKALGKRKGGPPSQAKQGAKKSKTLPTSLSSSSNSNTKTKGKEVELGPSGKPKRRPDQPKKIKLRDQKIIPVPRTSFAAPEKIRRVAEGSNDEDEEGFSESEDEDDEEMMDLGEEEGLEVLAGAGSFLASVDQTALSRSVKETKRLHDLSKAREPLPSKNRKRAASVASASTIDDYGLDSNSDFDSDLGSGDALDDDSNMDSGFDSAGPSGLASGSGSEDSDQDGLNAGYDEVSDEMSEDEEDSANIRRASKKQGKSALNNEADYEQSGRQRWTAPPKTQEDHIEVGRLPIKLPTGEVQIVKGTTKVALPPSKKKVVAESESEESEDEDEEDEASDDGAEAEVMAGVKGRFGRLGIAEIVGNEGWRNQQKLGAAKEQIAAIGAEILAGGELIDIGPVLTRLSTFALPTVPSVEDGAPPLTVPNSIRGLAFLSQLAVFKDLIPGYRIRDLTALEQAEKVRDEVRRLREGEKLLVKSYKGYLKTLEAEIKRRTPLASLGLRCMCDLLSAVPHFNFSENIMAVLVARVARRSWDEDSDLVLSTFITVFKNDISASHSQTLVRLIARMIKEKKFQVHPNVLSSLLHLRLKTELGAMRDGKRSKGKGKAGDGFGDTTKEGKKFKSDVRKQWQTKNMKKREKELKEVQKEMAEAEAEVDQEERASIQTETLKNLFVLYFSILKSPMRSPLLAAALEGISRFAHLVNIDFFRDLLAVLRNIIADQYEDEDDVVDPIGSGQRIRIRLLGIVTAFDLLSGQGEALNIDLGDFINQLFILLRPLSMDTTIEDPPLITSATLPKAHHQRPLTIGRTPPKFPPTIQTTSSLLFRCLHSIFFSKHISASTSPPWRGAAFAKRLLECSLHFPPDTARMSVEFVRQLVGKEPKLEALLDSEERTFDGVYKAEMDDPQLVNPFATSFWEVDLLAEKYWDRSLRKEAKMLRDGKIV